MVRWRGFDDCALGAIGSRRTREAAHSAEQRAARGAAWSRSSGLLVGGEQPGIGDIAGHTNTVLDIVGRIGVTGPSLVIYTDGNQLMVPAQQGDCRRVSCPGQERNRNMRYLNLDNVVVVTMPQPIVVQMIRTGAVALGNLMLDVSRASGLFPDIVMGGPRPLQRELRKIGVVEPHARYFSRDRGRALLVRKGNPFGIHDLADVARTGARVAQADCLWWLARAPALAPQSKRLIGKPAVPTPSSPRRSSTFLAALASRIGMSPK